MPVDCGEHGEPVACGRIMDLFGVAKFDGLYRLSLEELHNWPQPEIEVAVDANSLVERVELVLDHPHVKVFEVNAGSQAHFFHFYTPTELTMVPIADHADRPSSLVRFNGLSGEWTSKAMLVGPPRRILAIMWRKTDGTVLYEREHETANS